MVESHVTRHNVVLLKSFLMEYLLAPSSLPQPSILLWCQDLVAWYYLLFVAVLSQTSKSKGKKKGRGGGKTKVNIKNSPIFLKDGDIIGVKVDNQSFSLSLSLSLSLILSLCPYLNSYTSNAPQ